MKNKILPISIILLFIIIFYIFYKGLEDSKIYTPNLNKIVNNKYPKAIPIVVEVIAPTNLLNKFKPDAVVMDSSIKKRIFNK